MKRETLRVEGMSCQHCVNAIEKALQNIDVQSKVDLASQQVSVTYDEQKVKLEQIKEVIEEQGYEVV